MLNFNIYIFQLKINSLSPIIINSKEILNNYKYLGIVLLCAIIKYFGSGSLYLRKETGVFTL